MPSSVKSDLRYGALFGLLVVLLFPVVTQAAPTSGITVAPALLYAQIGSKQQQTSTTIGVRNNFEVPVTVSAELNGFDVRNNALVPTTTAEKTLAGVVTLSPAEIVIPPGTSKNITVLVNDSPNLSPGGHYLSILLTETAVNDRSGAPQLMLRPAVSATLYVIKEDGAIRSIQAQNAYFKHSLFSLPKIADIKFYNNGNVPSVARGVVQLRHGLDNNAVFGQGIVNEQSALLFPKSSITLQAQFQKIAVVKLPGRYQALLQYRYDGQEGTMQLAKTFWYIPKTFVVIAAVLITVVGLAIWPKSRFYLRRWWRRARRPRAPAYVAPDPAKIAKLRGLVSSTLLSKNKLPTARRKIDDIQRQK